MMNVRSLAAALIAATFLGCGSADGGASTSPTPPTTTAPPAAGSQNTVSVVNDAYQPAALTVSAGTQVTWTWNTCTGDGYGGQACVSHSVTFDDGTTSATQDSGSYSRTFANKGTYTYHCAVHGAAMSGTITVQ